MMTNAYDYSFATTAQSLLSLKEYEGKVILVVNTASRCGFTPQYAELEALYQRYKDQGLVIIGIPSNDFAQQEPMDNEKIVSFCNIHYGVTFPVAAKTVVTGKNAHPFYLWAKKTLGWLGAPKWNFHKYLINKEGELVDYFYSFTPPQAPRMLKAIEKALIP